MELLAQPLPFPHLLAAGVLSAEGEAATLSMLTSLRWKDHTEPYYRLGIAADGEQLDRAFETPALKAMVSDVSQALTKSMDLPLSAAAVELTAHMYDENTIIGFHTDAGACRKVRFVLNLNAGWSLADGGVWVLSNKLDLSEAAFLPPLSNTGFAFEANFQTFHALTRRSTRWSYALVASFNVY